MIFYRKEPDRDVLKGDGSYSVQPRPLNPLPPLHPISAGILGIDTPVHRRIFAESRI